MLEFIERNSFKDDIVPVGGSTPKVRSNIVALIGGFTPRRCGIATFTADVCASLKAAQPDLQIDVYAMTPALSAITFDASVISTITQGDPQSYIDAAQHIDISRADVVWLQHEFGYSADQPGIWC